MTAQNAPLQQVHPTPQTAMPSTVDADEEVFNVRIDAWADSDDSNIVFTAVSSNHKMSFSSADTCCSCTT